MKEINSYSSPFNFGHRALQDLFDGIVHVQEKVDGSQFSFGLFDGELFYRSRGQMVDPENAGMFALGVESVKSIAPMLTDGWIYRGEYLQKPKHNTLAYERVPKNHIILFDIDKGNQDYMLPDEFAFAAELVGLESVPYIGKFETKPTIDELRALLERKSILGGMIEGVVLKNYSRFGIDKKTLMAKYVSEAFVEKHTGDWKERNPSKNDIVERIIEEYSTDARRRKAIQHLRESGAIEGVVQDIPIVMREIAQDVLKESEAEIKERLFKHIWKDIARGLARGVPEWYKNHLVETELEQ